LHIDLAGIALKTGVAGFFSFIFTNSVAKYLNGDL